MAEPGTSQTYDLNVGTKIDMEDVIWLVSPSDVPLQGSMGADGLSALPTGTIDEVKYEWMDEVLLTPRTTMASLAVTAATTLYLAAGTGLNFQTGDVIFSPEGETMYVSGYGTTVDTIIVTRAYGGSAAAAQLVTGDTLVGVGSALAEGSDPPSARAKDRVDRLNYSQIFGPTAVSVSGTEQVVKKYGLTGTEFDHQLGLRLKEMAIAIDQACLYGIPYAGTATNGRMMGGIKNFITTNVDSTTTQLTDTALLNSLQNCYDAGGNPDRVIVGSKQKRIISGFQSGDVRIESDSVKWGTRGYKVSYFESDYSMVSVVLDRWVRLADLFIIERDQASIETLRPMLFEMLAKTGDSVKGQVVAEKGFRFRMQSHAAAMNALT